MKFSLCTGYILTAFLHAIGPRVWIRIRSGLAVTALETDGPIGPIAEDRVLKILVM